MVQGGITCISYYGTACATTATVPVRSACALAENTTWTMGLGRRLECFSSQQVQAWALPQALGARLLYSPQPT
eukprot:2536758-Amphidinium_carterae.1